MKGCRVEEVQRKKMNARKMVDTHTQTKVGEVVVRRGRKKVGKKIE